MQQNGNLVIHLHIFTVCKNVLIGHISLPSTLRFKSVTVYFSKMIMLRLAFGDLIKLLVRSITIYVQNDISVFVVSISQLLRSLLSQILAVVCCLSKHFG